MQSSTEHNEVSLYRGRSPAAGGRGIAAKELKPLSLFRIEQPRRKPAKRTDLTEAFVTFCRFFTSGVRPSSGAATSGAWRCGSNPERPGHASLAAAGTAALRKFLFLSFLCYLL